MSLTEAASHPELITTQREIALASNKLLAIEQQGLRLAPLIHASKLPRAEATDILIRSAEANGLYGKPRERETVEHVIRMSLNGRPAGVDYVPSPNIDTSWPEPDMRLVSDDRPAAPLLNDDALPAGWEMWITDEATARGCPRDYIVAGLIGAASAWIGNSRRVAATADWSEPAHLWIALIGAPSVGKTPALRPMVEASRLLERDAEPAWRDKAAQHEREAEIARARAEAWRKDVHAAAANGADPPDRPSDAQEPAKPSEPRVLAMDTSTEELQHMLASNPRGLLHVRDELSGWFGGFDRYNSGRGADRAFWLETWNGGAFVCDRVRYHGAPVRIEHASVGIIGGMVPDRLR
jgi:putative DNA primase/helicase